MKVLAHYRDNEGNASVRILSFHRNTGMLMDRLWDSIGSYLFPLKNEDAGKFLKKS